MMTEIKSDQVPFEETADHSTLDVPCTGANLFNLMASKNEFILLLQELCPRLKDTGEISRYERKPLHFWRFSPQTAVQLLLALRQGLEDNGFSEKEIEAHLKKTKN